VLYIVFYQKYVQGFKDMFHVINNTHSYKQQGQNCALLGYYAASSGNSLPKFRDNLWVKKVQEDSCPLELELDSLFRNMGKVLPLLAA